LLVDKLRSDSSKFHQASGNILVYINRDSLSENLEYGDRVSVFGTVRKLTGAKNPNAFNFKDFQHYQNIHYQLFLKENEWKISEKNGGNPLFKFAFKQRREFLHILRKYLPDTESFSVGSALILGYKDEMDEEVRDAYAKTGAMHVLAVSGLHVGLIYLIIGFIFDKIMRWDSRKIRYLRGAICLISVWLFALLTGMSPSVMRASTMFSIIIIGNMTDRFSNIYNSLATSAFILLLINPLYIMSVGFQLSYLAVTGIVYFQPKIYSLYICENNITDFFWQLCTVSIAAQFATLPLSLYYFHQFPIYFWLSGLIVVPAAGFILGGGLFLFLLESIYAGLGIPIGFLLYWLIWCVNKGIFFLQNLPASVIEGIWITGISALILYFSIALLVSAINTRRGRNLTYSVGLLTIAFMLIAWQKSRLINNRQLIVYDLYKNTLVECIDKNEAYTVNNKELNKKKFNFSTKNNHYAHSVDKVNFFNIDSLSYENDVLLFEKEFIHFYDKKVFLVDKMPVRDKEIIKVNFLIIRGNPRLNLEKLFEIFSFEKVIFDNSNSQYKVRDWIKYCEDNNIDFHYTATDGAWILTL
ncbi:MAG: competence protein ComEC, partial [Saprospiraceae bacterium]